MMTPEQYLDVFAVLKERIAELEREIAESLQVQEVLRKEITSVRDRMREKEARIAELVGWMKAANKFAWAHERTCPRHDYDEPCNCGLDAFLCRPRPVIESFHARIAELELALMAAHARIDAAVVKP